MAASAPRTELGRIKGAAFRELVAWFEVSLGREGIAEVADALPERVRAQLRLDLRRESLGILSSRWYPTEATHPLLEGLFAKIPPSEYDATIESVAAAVMRATLRGIYRILFDWLATPERYARSAGRLWRSYYDSGEMHVDLRAPGHAVCTLRDWHSHHPISCDLDVVAATEIYAAMGCKGVTTVRDKCVSHGHDECRFITTWTPDER